MSLTMIPENQVELARQLTACKSFRWIPGMMAFMPDIYDSYAFARFGTAQSFVMHKKDDVYMKSWIVDYGEVKVDALLPYFLDFATYACLQLMAFESTETDFVKCMEQVEDLWRAQ